MIDERWIKAHRPSDGLRYHNDAVEYGRMMGDRWRVAAGQRVETIRWCETHGSCGHAMLQNECQVSATQPRSRNNCEIVEATLILPPKQAEPSQLVCR